MSCLQISDRALAGVSTTIISASFWREQTEGQPLSFYHYITGEYSNTEERAKDCAKTFVYFSMLFNYMELEGGELKSTDVFNADLERVWNKVQDRLSVMQLLKTLQMIDYNTDVKGQMEQEQYDNWSLKSEYESYKKHLDETISYLAEFIVSRMPEYRAAKWDF